MDSQKQQQESNTLSVLDSLYCEEEHWVEEEYGLEEEEINDINYNNNGKNPSFLSLLLLEQDLFWEDEELLSLFSKEQQTHLHNTNLNTDPSLVVARQEAVEWMLKVNAHYSFSALTAVLAVNYLDRFLSSFNFQKDKPWMIQLVALTCLSLAAKVEETDVPLLLDLQVEETKYVFEAKTIQRMELLVLSTLHWKMNPVTPLSFLDHIMRRLGLKTDLHWEFLKKCESLLLSIIADSRFVGYLPSILATATMLRVIDQVEASNPTEYKNQLMGVLKIDKEEVNVCYKLILESTLMNHGDSNNHKRKNHQFILSSPKGVIDVSFSFDSSNSNDSWALGSSVSSSPEPLFKKRRTQDQRMRLPSFDRIFVVDVLTSPR